MPSRRHIWLARPASRGQSTAAAPGAGTESDLLRQTAALAGVVRRYHRIVAREAPALAVGLGRHIIGGLQMPLEHLQLLPVLQAHDVVRLHRPFYAYRRLWSGLRRSGRGADMRQRIVDLVD